MNSGRVGEDSLDELCEGETDGPGGVSLKLDDLVSALHDLGVGILPVLIIGVQADVLVQVPEPHASDVHARPDGHCENVPF